MAFVTRDILGVYGTLGEDSVGAMQLLGILVTGWNTYEYIECIECVFLRQVGWRVRS